MKKVYAVAAAGLFFLLSTGQVLAISLSDVTLEGNNATAAFGPFGNVSGDANNLNLVNAQNFFGYGTGSFSQLDKTDGDSSLFDNSWLFTITAQGGNAGTFLLSWTGGSLPATFDFVFQFKASNESALYLFNDVGISETPSAPGYTGTYAIHFDPNKNGIFPDLSHISVYGRYGEPTNEVPEPATMLLFGAGLAGLAGLRRKIRK